MCAVPSLRSVIRALTRNGWLNIGGSLHDKWTPPDGKLTVNGKSHIAIPRKNCNPRTLKRIIKQSGLNESEF